MPDHERVSERRTADMARSRCRFSALMRWHRSTVLLRRGGSGTRCSVRVGRRGVTGWRA